MFLKGFPDATAKTDAAGAFTLEVVVPGEALLEGDEYTIVAWYEPSAGAAADKLDPTGHLRRKK